jgi:hypothetical protein
VGPVIERYGNMEWRITGCSDGNAVQHLRIEEANPSASIPRAVVYVKTAGGGYRLAENDEPRDERDVAEALDGLRALTPLELAELEQRLRTAQ